MKQEDHDGPQLLTRFNSFQCSYDMHTRKTSDAPLVDCNIWTVFVEGHPRNICAKLFWNRAYVLLQDYFLKFHYTYKSSSLVVILINGSK